MKYSEPPPWFSYELNQRDRWIVKLFQRKRTASIPFAERAFIGATYHNLLRGKTINPESARDAKIAFEAFIGPKYVKGE